MSVIEPAWDVCDTGLLALDHRVREVHVGRRFVDEALTVAVDDELRRHHPLVEHELQAPVGPADRREPPCLVEQVGGPADLLARADAVTHRDAGLPKLQSFSSTGRCSLRHAMSWSNPPVARMTPPGHRCAAPSRLVRPQRPSRLPSTSVINSVIGESSHSGMSVLLHRQPQIAPPATARWRPSGRRTPAPGTSARSA